MALNLSEIARKCLTKFCRRERPSVPDLRNFHCLNAPRQECDRTVLRSENIEAIDKSMPENLSTSTRHRSREFIISCTNFWEKISI